jgi:hypothetical protein
LKAGREGGRGQKKGMTYLFLLFLNADLEQPTTSEAGREGERKRKPFLLFFAC